MSSSSFRLHLLGLRSDHQTAREKRLDLDRCVDVLVSGHVSSEIYAHLHCFGSSGHPATLLPSGCYFESDFFLAFESNVDFLLDLRRLSKVTVKTKEQQM